MLIGSLVWVVRRFQRRGGWYQSIQVIQKIFHNNIWKRIWKRSVDTKSYSRWILLMWSQDSRLLCLVLVSYLSRFDADITKISWSYFVSRITFSFDSSHYLVSLTPYPRIVSLCLVLHFSVSVFYSLCYLVLLSHFYLFVVPRVCVSYQYDGSYRVIGFFVLGISFIRRLSFV